jgi:ParB-like chromosome segregation protein Spo0J
VQVPLSDIRPGVQLRTGKFNQDHLDGLALSGGAWPPIVIRHNDMTIVDGHYRYLAASRLGRSHIDCVYFDGTEESVFLEALRRNRDHGLPLSFRDREGAARHLLRFHQEWSDRRIGTACGVAPGTVGRLRSEIATPSDGERGASLRIGRDGRRRPVDPVASRRRISEALRDQPDASLREIARMTGVSPATVRAVRIGTVESELTPSADEQGRRETGLLLQLPAPSRPAGWTPDAAVVSTTDGENFAKWFERTNLGDEWRIIMTGIPISRIYEVADEARRRALVWQEFATSLEARTRPQHAIQAL